MLKDEVHQENQDLLTNINQINIPLKDSFQRFLKARTINYKHKKNERELKKDKEDKTTQEWKQMLRLKFVQQAKSYFGVPYAQKYLSPGDKLYNAALFLDCCALIRQIIFDLREDFGFTMARWNQAYQYDMLDKEIAFEDMKFGDLIFVSATFYSKHARNFQHKMVHVEIYTGEGTKEGTIGSRSKGVVSAHDTYKFESKNYYDQKYHYKSINPWLEGVFKSFCAEHDWIDDRNLWVGEKYSVFNQDDDADKDDLEGQDDSLPCKILIPQDEQVISQQLAIQNQIINIQNE